jgi:hypothetical protein
VFGRHRQTSVTAGPQPEEPKPEFPTGPYDVEDEPDDGWSRLDLGSLRLPIPEGAQLQVEVDRSGPLRALHLITGLGQFTITAFAAPRSGGLWREVIPELATKLRGEGAWVGLAAGEWGQEIEAVTNQGALRFLGVDGPRWMLRGVASGPPEHAQPRAVVLRDIVRQTVVVRGSDPLPVRSPLPLQLPEALAEQLEQATAELVNATAGDSSSAGLG